MKLLGLSPKGTFSGFETSFFNSIEAQGAQIRRVEVELPIFKLLSTLISFHPDKKRWGTRRDIRYHTSIAAFKKKSAFTQRKVLQLQDSFDAIYQIGGLWNPIGSKVTKPFFTQVDYTSFLSKKRNSEWKRKPGIEEDFWISQEKKLYDTAEIILTTTENARRSIVVDYGVQPEKVITVGAGVSPPYDQFEAKRSPRYDSCKILFVGKGFVGKGLDTLLEAFSSVKERLPNARLTIVGPTDENIGGEGVTYLGRIADRNRVRELYWEHSLFVMPSRFEPLGQVFLEAMSCHLPCIGTTVDAMPEIIDHNRTGYTIEPGDANRLAEYILRVLKDPQLAAQMGQAGFRKLQMQYTWDVVGKKIYNLIKSLL